MAAALEAFIREHEYWRRAGYRHRRRSRLDDVLVRGGRCWRSWTGTLPGCAAELRDHPPGIQQLAVEWPEASEPLTRTPPD